MEADTDADALSAVEKAYRNGDVVLDGSDFKYGTEEMFIEDIQDNIKKAVIKEHIADDGTIIQ